MDFKSSDGTGPGAAGPGGSAVDTMSGPRSEDALPASAAAAVKIVIVGGFGVGKTTLVGSVSEIRPLTTEETMTQAGVGIDDVAGVERKTSTTVAMDFGRISINDELVLYLFGTPGQQRFLPLWEDLARGALGALVLVDTRRLDKADEVLAHLEERGVPFAVAVNEFETAQRFPLEDIREALDLEPTTPLITVDARDRRTCLQSLITLVEFLFHRLEPHS
jgi:uncharacterized protein